MIPPEAASGFLFFQIPNYAEGKYLSSVFLNVSSFMWEWFAVPFWFARKRRGIIHENISGVYGGSSWPRSLWLRSLCDSII